MYDIALNLCLNYKKEILMITLNDAKTFIAATEKKSAEIGQAMNIRHRIWLKPIHDFSNTQVKQYIYTDFNYFNYKASTIQMTKLILSYLLFMLFD